MDPDRALAGAALARNSLSVAQWTLVSRLSGFARVVVVAAALGPTYLGNTFQATNTMPALVFELLTGTLVAGTLVPALVRHVDSGDAKEAERVAGGLLGTALAGFGVIVVLGIAGAPLLFSLLSATVDDPATAEAQRDTGIVLLALLMPQVVFYAVAAIAGAVMNAHGRFALAAAAPALENVGVILTMVVFVVSFGAGGDVESVGTAELVVLGVGTTAAVALHAAAQWWGARRVGVVLLPRRGWRDPELRELLRAGKPSLGYAALNAVRFFALIVAANSIAGGVVAFSLALNFYFLPTALAARPVSLALLPRLARLYQSGRLERFRDEFVHGLGLIAFLVIPAATAYLVLAEPLARAASFGELANSDAVALVAASLASLAVGVLGEAAFVMGTNAAYALDDPVSPFRAMVLRTVVTLAGVPVALSVDSGPGVLVALGLAVSLGNAAGVLDLVWRILRRLPPSSERLAPAVLRALAASALMAGPAYVAAAAISDGSIGGVAAVATMLVAAVVGAVAFLAAQRAWRSPELGFFTGALAARRDIRPS